MLRALRPFAFATSLGLTALASPASAQLALRPPLSGRWLAQNAPPTALAPSLAPQCTTPECVRVADANRLRPGRWVVSPLVGWASGTLLGVLAGLGASALMCTPSDTYETCVGAVVLGAYAGFLAGAPLGITISAGWFRGLGAYTGALLGTLFGVALAVPVALIARSEFITYSIGAIPALGGLIVYEIQGAARARTRATPALTVTPSVAPVGADGHLAGLALGLTLRGL